MQRCLIVNADDFGQSEGITSGIMRAHEHGIVTSTSFMVRWPAAAQAAAWARAHPALSLGLHCDFGEWTFRNGEWHALYEVVPLDDAHAVAKALRTQLAEFERLTGRSPTHLDSHQHVHRREPVACVMQAVAAELAIPLRGQGAEVTYCGDFYAQADDGTSLEGAVGVDALVRLLKRLPAGTTELVCHPAAHVDFEGLYCAERVLELQTLCDPRVRRAIEVEGIALKSFAALACVSGAGK